MASVNKVIVMGNLGKDPEVRYMPNGDAVCNITVATSRRWKDKASGEAQEETEWHRIVFYGRQAEVAGQYLKKGRPVYVEGRLKTRKWQDKDGVDRYTTEIVAGELQLMGGRDDDEEGGQQRGERPASRTPAPAARQQPQGRGTGYASRSPAAPAPAPRQATAFDDMDDDIPF